MANSVKFTDNSRAILAAIPPAEQRALETIGLVAEGYAKKLAPVDTGNLRNSISHAVEDKAAYIGTNVEYAAFVEIGTSRSKAQPYLKPAASDHARTYRNIIETEMRKG